MANRINGNIYIIDSATTQTVDIDWPRNVKVETIAFWASNSATGAFELVDAATSANSICRFGPPANGNGGRQEARFNGINVSAVRVKTLTAGTGWIIFA